jgi:hypothetical protein
MNVTNNGFPRRSLRNHISGAAGKKLGTCYIDILRKEIHWFAENGVQLTSTFFKTTKNGSVLQNEVKHIRRVLFLSKTTVTMP